MRATSGVFIRSMATRGHLGGLARATGDAALVLDAAGKDVVIIETVGVGQDEVDIVRTADVSIVVLVPGTGDEVQALKAGIMEIADIFVVNKADRDGADRMVSSIESNLALQQYGDGRVAPADREDRRRRPARACRSCGCRSWQFREHSAAHAGSPSPHAKRVPAAGAADAPLHGTSSSGPCWPPASSSAIVDRIAAREVDPYTAANDLLRRASSERESPERESLRA